MLEFSKKAGTARLFVALLALVFATSLLALVLHLKAETHGDGDGNEARPSIAVTVKGGAEADALARRLHAHLAQQPRDARGWAILARLHFEQDRFADAAQAYEKALALPSKVANDPAVWCEYADALGMTQGGKLAGKPREIIDRALVLKPNHPKALEMAGSSEYERGDYAAALNYWRQLLTALEPGSQPYQELAAAIVRAERLAMMQVRR